MAEIRGIGNIVYIFLYALFWMDPISDPRWTEFIAWHPSSSIFHTPAWLRALPEICRREKLKYVELRPLVPLSTLELSVSARYRLHPAKNPAR